MVGSFSVILVYTCINFKHWQVNFESMGDSPELQGLDKFGNASSVDMHCEMNLNIDSHYQQSKFQA